MLNYIRAAVVVSSLLCILTGRVSAAELQSPTSAPACAVPEYSAVWRADEQEGNVGIKVLVQPDGSVTDAKVVSSSGYATLDKASLRASAKCKFKPASNGGEKTQSWVNVRYTWIIK